MNNKFMHMRIKIIQLLILVLFMASCKPKVDVPAEPKADAVKPELTLELAESIKKLPLHCITTEYPNTWGQRLYSEADIKSPKTLHPTFYGCFDWHSSVHGHWSLVKILKLYPEISDGELIRKGLKTNISAANIAIEIDYLNNKRTQSFERPYGWAWVLKLAEELHSWDDPLGRELYANLKPLADVISKKLITYLPTLKTPVRSGTHNNTAFSLCFIWDYANTFKVDALKDVVALKSKDYYLADTSYNLSIEPEGSDFLSPAFEEIDLMSRVLPKEEFSTWVSKFLPQLADKNFTIAPGIVKDRTDGQLGHIDGLNFSRAWCMLDLANKFPEYAHLRPLAYEHLQTSIDGVSDGVGGNYESSGHWLGSFALYALSYN